MSPRPCVVLLDSGSDHTLVRQDSLPKDLVFCGGTVNVICIHGDEVGCPIAEMAIQVKDKLNTLSVGGIGISALSGCVRL